MPDLGPHIAHSFPTEPYNSGAEQSNEQELDFLSGTGSWVSRPVPGRANVSNSHHTSDGMRNSFNCRSATDKREGSTVNPSQLRNSVPMANNTARPTQGTYLQGINYQTNESTLGIDQVLVGLDFWKEYGYFAEDANDTKTEA